MRKPIDNQKYLGDGVYVDCDGYHVILTTTDGMGRENKIFLDDTVVTRLKEYFEYLQGPPE